MATLGLQLKIAQHCHRYPGILLLCMAVAYGATAQPAPAPAPAAANSSVATTEQAWAAVLAATMLASNNGAHIHKTTKPEMRHFYLLKISCRSKLCKLNSSNPDLSSLYVCLTKSDCVLHAHARCVSRHESLCDDKPSAVTRYSTCLILAVDVCVFVQGVLKELRMI